MAALTAENKRQIRRLLKSGRWNNESEIIRYGLHLVVEEVDQKLKASWPEPISDAEMDRIHRQQLAEQKADGKAAKADRKARS